MAGAEAPAICVFALGPCRCAYDWNLVQFAAMYTKRKANSTASK